MARPMPSLAKTLAYSVQKAISIAEAGERIRLSATRGDVAFDELYPARLEALYEMAFLRVFVEWEVFLEESFIRYLCGYESSCGPAALIATPFKTLDDARTDVLGSSDFVSWQSTTYIIKRCRMYMPPLVGGTTPANSFHERVVVSNQARLDALASIRNRVAHKSAHSKKQFDNATLLLAGRLYRAGSPGRFLRDRGSRGTPPQRWLYLIAQELRALALQITP